MPGAEPITSPWDGRVAIAPRGDLAVSGAAEAEAAITALAGPGQYPIIDMPVLEGCPGKSRWKGRALWVSMSGISGGWQERRLR